MEKLNDVITAIDDFVWGPVMLILLVGTGIFLTIRTRFLTWRNLGYALKSTLSKEARTKSRGEGDVSPFSALTTALAATSGTTTEETFEMDLIPPTMISRASTVITIPVRWVGT